MFFCRYFSGTSKMKYNDAVRTLNFLQVGQTFKNGLARDEGCLAVMQQFLERVSLTQDDLKKLNVIHISGTKGKGSTCAFVESILRHHGYKTGFFSSPHLIEVRERIRINGKPIGRSEFAGYFEEVYKRLSETQSSYDVHFPSYFYFLTTMAFHVFMEERVDVAIMEVGIGGAFDCTNVVKHPAVCGVSSLGYDHTKILGDTIESIAWHKAGIFKPGAPAFTAPQAYTAMQVMAQNALETQVTLSCAPDLSSYRDGNKKKITLGLAGEYQKVNASLALQIAECWMKQRNHKKETEKHIYLSEIEAYPSPADHFTLTDTHLAALADCKWQGRSQVMKFNNLTFYFDGAHTTESMKCCGKWFREEANKEEKVLGQTCVRILAFNVTKKRDAHKFFDCLKDCEISYALFMPNIATLVQTDSADQNNLTAPLESQMMNVIRNYEQWLDTKRDCDVIADRRVEVQMGNVMVQRERVIVHSSSPRESDDCFESPPHNKIPIFPSIADAVVWLSKNRDMKLCNDARELSSDEEATLPYVKPDKHVQVLVTGSVHLVGGFLRVIDPHMND